MRALEAALNAAWAMEEGALEALLAIAARENDITPEALEAYRAQELARAELATVRDGVAIVGVRGPLFRRANLMTAFSGASSYDVLNRDFRVAVDDSKVKGVILNIDSPGGEVNGANEFAQSIFDARGIKPIVAYVGGSGSSAAYLVGSAADRIVVDPTAILGSLGVQMGIREPDPKAGEKVYRFVSSQSPMKNASPATDDGAKAIQAVVDALGQVLVETVARNRGVATETVLKDFGKGGLFVGQAAVKAGLADSVGNFEAVLAELSGAQKKAAPGGRGRKEGASMSDENGQSTATENSQSAPAAAPAPAAPAASAAPAVDVNAAVAAAMTAERTRVTGLQRLATAHAIPADKLSAAIESGSTVEAFALQIADSETAKAAARIEALKQDEATGNMPGASTGAETDANSADAIAKQIIASAKMASGEAA